VRTSHPSDCFRFQVERHNSAGKVFVRINSDEFIATTRWIGFEPKNWLKYTILEEKTRRCLALKLIFKIYA